jgi:hypothetical protein
LLKIIDEAGEIEGNEEWEIKEILLSSKVKGKVLYQVKWKGFPLKKDHTEEPYESFIVGGLQSLQEFYSRNPGMLRDQHV